MLWTVSTSFLLESSAARLSVFMRSFLSFSVSFFLCIGHFPCVDPPVNTVVNPPISPPPFAILEDLSPPSNILEDLRYATSYFQKKALKWHVLHLSLYSKTVSHCLISGFASRWRGVWCLKVVFSITTLVCQSYAYYLHKPSTRYERGFSKWERNTHASPPLFDPMCCGLPRFSVKLT